MRHIASDGVSASRRRARAHIADSGTPRASDTRPDRFDRRPRSRTDAETRAGSRERADAPRRYAISGGLLKQPDKQDTANQMIAEFQTANRIACPVCRGTGTCRGRTYARGQRTHHCPLCDGSGFVGADKLTSVETLRKQMQRVADAMQAGDADRAAIEARIAGRIAQRVLTPT